MDDLISRQAAIAHAISGLTRELDGEKWIRVSEVRESLQTMPSAQPERKTGRWLQTHRGERGFSRPGFRCNQCGEVNPRSRYCPSCGARMEESDE